MLVERCRFVKLSVMTLSIINVHNGDALRPGDSGLI